MGSPKAPHFCLKVSLEAESQRHLNEAPLVRHRKDGARSRDTTLPCDLEVSYVSSVAHILGRPALDVVIGVIQQVVELRAKLQPKALGDRERLSNLGVDVVGTRPVESITARQARRPFAVFAR